MDGQHEKERGIRLFGEKQYQEAIEAYSEAIVSLLHVYTYRFNSMSTTCYV